MNKRRLNLFITLFIILMFTGCTPSKIVSIKSNPSGAKVIVNDQNVGNTPLRTKLEFPQKQDVTIWLSKQEYKVLPAKIALLPKDLTEYNFDLERKETKEVELIEFKPLQTTIGIRLQKQKTISLAYLETIERSPNVKSVTRVTNVQDSLVQVGHPCVSPKGDAIVFYIYEFENNNPLDGYSNLYRMPIGSASQTKLSFGNKLDLFPAYSPNGEFIYFSSNRITDNPTIWKVRAGGGGGLTAITNGKSEDIMPSPFADGKAIAYTSLLPGTTEPQIWTIQNSGTLPTQLREGESANSSIKDDKIAYIKANRNINANKQLLSGESIAYNPLQIWTMTREGGEETQMSQNTEYNCIDPKWSPDGEYIVFASDEGKDSKGRNNFDIWMMKKDGTQKTQLTTNGSWDDNPCWSPDGKKIYFRSNRGGTWNIWFFELNTN